MKKLIVLLLIFLPGYAGSAEPLISKKPGLAGPGIGGIGGAIIIPLPESLIAKYSYTYLPASTQTDNNGKPIQSASPLPLKDGQVLHSGDYYNLQFTPKQACYVYIFQFDTSNKLFKLFPPKGFIGADTRSNNNPVQANRPYFVPGKGKYFKLNAQTGPEKIHFLVSRTPNAELEKNIWHTLMLRKLKKHKNRLT